MIATSFALVIPIIVFIYVVGIWKAFEKAGEPGWAAIIPFYNWWVMLRIGGKPAWWFVMLLFPFINLFFVLATFMGIARNFGERNTFGLGLFFLGVVFWPILGYGDQVFRPEEKGRYDDHYVDEYEVEEDFDERIHEEDFSSEEDDWDPLSDRQN